MRRAAAFGRPAVGCLFTAGLLFGGVVSAAAAQAEHAHGEPSKIEVDEGLLSVEVSDAPVTEVLEAIGEQAEFELKVRGELGETARQAFEGVPLEDGIRRLVGGNPVNLVMSYEVGKDGKRRLAEVRAHAARAVSAEAMEELRMRLSIRREEPPPPPPPPPEALAGDH